MKPARTMPERLVILAAVYVEGTATVSVTGDVVLLFTVILVGLNEQVTVAG